MSGPVVYTLGHSRHPIEHFIGLAARHAVGLIVDVRGQPFSRFNPQFNRERFRAALAAAEIDYLWLGETLSGRPADPRFRDAGGEVDWAAVRAWPAFRADVARIHATAGDRRLAMVCAEEDPLRCHRRFLLTPELLALGAEVRHIRGDGRIETEDDVAARERPKHRSQPDLFDEPG